MPKESLIAIVDDVDSIRAALQGLVRSMGFDTAAFDSGIKFLNSPLAEQVACVIADVQMPGMTGPELHQHMLARGWTVPVILVTAYANDRVREQALNAGVVGYLTKPLDDDDLITCLHIALERDRNP